MAHIILDFGSVTLNAELFDTGVAQGVHALLPRTLNLTRWGDEVYGALPVAIDTENPVPHIPAGGIAYTNNGNYLCIFFGQQPAWPVEYIGQIQGNTWELLVGAQSLEHVTISLAR